MDFTYSSYQLMIKIALDNGYKICSYEKVNSHKKEIILRHDVDFDLEKSLQMAKLEHTLGVSSTYFVLLSTDFYNVFSKKSVNILNQILDMNHHIGLHFDEQRYNTNIIEKIKKNVIKEVSILEMLLEKPVKVVSMHRPTQITLDSDISFENLINSYSSYFFNTMKYISDSRMNWRENILEIIESNAFEKIHILTHPFWYSDKNEMTQEKLLNFINDSKISRFNFVNDNFKNLSEYIKCEDIK